MPLEIKYNRPIEEIIYSDDEKHRITVHSNSAFVQVETKYEIINFTYSDFKQWAAAVYKFSQEI